MATLQWDHAVQFVNQPEAAIQTLPTSSCGRVAGGRHPGWGTRNALSYFGLTYIEFLAISDTDELRAATDRFLLSRDAERLLPENEALFRWRCAATTSRPLMTSCVARGWRYHRLSMVSATIRRAISSAGGSSPSMATLTGWSIHLCCSGEKTILTRLARAARSGTGRPHPLGDIALEQAVFGGGQSAGGTRSLAGAAGLPATGEQGLTWAASGLLSAKDPLTS